MYMCISYTLCGKHSSKNQKSITGRKKAMTLKFSQTLIACKKKNFDVRYLWRLSLSRDTSRNIFLSEKMFTKSFYCISKLHFSENHPSINSLAFLNVFEIISGI